MGESPETIGNEVEAHGISDIEAVEEAGELICGIYDPAGNK